MDVRRWVRNLGFLMMFATCAAAVGTNLVVGMMPRGRRRYRIERRMSTVVVWMGLVTCALFVCTL